MIDQHQRYTFPRKMRLSGRSAFSAVYSARCRKVQGPIVVHGRPNDLAHLRLGLSLSRRVGNAVARNRIKRLLRESFRHLQHDLPGGYDLVIVVRPHEPLSLATYQHLLHRAVLGIHRQWSKHDQ